MERAHQVVGRGLAAEYGEFGAYGVVFGELARVAERTVTSSVDTCRKAERAARASSALPVVARRFEQAQRADDVGLHERGRAVDGTVDMLSAAKLMIACGRVRPTARDQRGVADIAMAKT
jgi:hypothetical protein